MKTVVLLVLSGSAAIASGISIGLWLAGQQSRAPPVADANTAAPERATARRAPQWIGRLARLEQRLLALEGRNGEAAHAAPQPVSALPNAPPPEDEGESLDGESGLDFVTRAEAAQAFNDQKVATLEATLENEPRDPDWAESTAEELSLTFEQQGLTGSELDFIECRSTFCALRAVHSSATARTDFQMFAIAMSNMGAELIFSETPDGELETHGYFIREGFDSADHPARESF